MTQSIPRTSPVSSCRSANAQTCWSNTDADDAREGDANRDFGADAAADADVAANGECNVIGMSARVAVTASMGSNAQLNNR
jgi:hypothetical protein